ncbi:MAG: GH3 auxin-responsive promoter family protein [Opitutaceae bacterium]
MLAWSKSFLTFSASLLTARMAAHLRRKNAAAAEQKKGFDLLTARLAATAFWRQAGIEAGMSYERFRARVSPRGYAQLAPAVERMKRGETDVLWPGRCVFFATTSATTGGGAKFLPVTEEMLGHFRQAGLDSLLYYTARVGHAGVFRGRHLFVNGSTALTPLAEAKNGEAYAGDLAGITVLNLPSWAEKRHYEPGAAIDQIDDWVAKLQAIIARTSSRDISLLAGIPNWVLMLAHAIRDKSSEGRRRITSLQGLWPNLECFVHGGLLIAPFQEQLRAVLGPTVKFHEVYPAAEGFIAAQDGETSAGLRLMTDAGLFFEFLPMTDFDEARLEHLGQKVLPLADVKPGVDYALLVTTPGGLARYPIGDVIRFVSTEPPRLIHVGRTQLQLAAFGERVSEREATEALLAVCNRQGWTIVNFHVAPQTAGTFIRQSRGGHEWWIELKPGTLATPTSPQIAHALDVELHRINPLYAARRQAGVLEPPNVRLVMPGVFEHWMRYRGKWGGQHKMPRCRSDRLVADELAQVTNFARD